MKVWMENHWVHNEELIIWEKHNNIRAIYQVYNVYWEEIHFQGTYEECLEFIKDYRIERLQELVG